MITTSRLKALVPAAALALTLGAGGLAAPSAHAAPQHDPAARHWESLPAPVVPQQPGYQITGYNVGKGNYRGAIDQKTGSLWLTNVSPLEGAKESSILKVDPNTMRVQKRIRMPKASNTGGHGTVNAQYDIGVPKRGGTVWTTAATTGEVNVWDTGSGKLLKTFTGVNHAHGIVFADDLGLAIVSASEPGGIVIYDLNTLQEVGRAKQPGAGKQLAAGMAVTDSSAGGATITVASYYSSLTQFRITRENGAVKTKVLWNTHQGGDGHGSVEVSKAHNRVYVNNLYKGLVQVYNLRTGAHITDLVTGPGTNSMIIFQGKLYAANYFAGYISVIDQNTLGVSRLLTTGFAPNQLLAWKPNTFLVIDKSSIVLDGGYTQNRGVDRIWKVRSLR
ncbi:hypothetical protein [Gordonia sp. (in: high G+C Gram-positive bacteria)]|uniref:YncE family protein n=1 Tax=Gordonia sp. (in: high G+C Gram-positive bacteria) TaxID=84139 RepID=UPI0026106EC5|nr:hypothetical protein [Gordonia sp. (in: high G+C Gram-positive bacteria)]